MRFWLSFRIHFHVAQHVLAVVILHWNTIARLLAGLLAAKVPMQVIAQFHWIWNETTLKLDYFAHGCLTVLLHTVIETTKYRAACTHTQFQWNTNVKSNVTIHVVRRKGRFTYPKELEQDFVDTLMCSLTRVRSASDVQFYVLIRVTSASECSFDFTWRTTCNHSK